jgi:replication factor A1
MLVVGDLGRKHVKIKGLAGKSSLFSFFGRVLDRTEPREFVRADGEKGYVATILLGDETGTCRVVLWDEKAGAALDVANGEVLEVIGRHSGKSMSEIHALALRKASCEVACAVPPAGSGPFSLSAEPVDLEVAVLSVRPPRPFNRKDGTTGTMAEMLVGDSQGTARVVAWDAGLLDGIFPGSSVSITGAKPNLRDGGRAFSIDDKCKVTVLTTRIDVPFTPLVSVSDQGTYSVQGEVKETREPRSFTSRSGAASWVRNITITDGSEDLRVVLWGEHALAPLSPGDRIEVYHAQGRPSRFSGIELSAGGNSILRVPQEKAVPVVFCGMIIKNSGCTFIDNGRERYIADTALPEWTLARITGTLAGNRIIVEHEEPVIITADEISGQLEQFLSALDK